MKAYGWFEWKRWMHSKKNVVLLVLLVCVELLTLRMMMQMDRYTDPVPMTDPETIWIRPLKAREQLSMLSEQKKQEAYALIEQSEKDMEFLRANLEKADLAKQHEEWQPFLKASIVNFLMLVRLEEISEATSFHEQDFIHQKQIEALYRQYDAPDLGRYASIANLPMGHSSYPVYEKYVRYFDALVENHLVPASVYDVSAGTVFLQLARSVLPVAAVLLTGCLFWQTKKERRAESMLLTVPYLRRRLVRYESVARAGWIGFWLVVPIALMSVFFGMTQGWSSWHTPVLVFAPGLTSFATPLAQTQDGMMSIPIGLTILNGDTYVEPAMELMSCAQVTGLALLLGGLFVLFLVEYELFLEKVFPTSFLATIVYFISIGLLRAAQGGAWNPMRYMDPVSVLTGYAGASYGAGLCVLFGYTALFWLLNRWLTKKRVR